MTSGNTVRIDFHSSLGMLDFVQMISEYIARTVGLDDDSVHWVTVAVRESVVNAIKHGNGYDVHKRVHIEFAALDDSGAPGIAILVRDEGCGFDPTTIADPLAPENLLKANGRGIFLMRSFMDEMTFERSEGGGMQVRMVKRVPQSQLA
jgi:serine/threonine-protein kinase RsbW